MCDFEHHGRLLPLPENEYVLDTRRARDFIATVRTRVEHTDLPAEACELISPLFADLLSDRDWLPARYQGQRQTAR
jgi:hypothetical protein